jgi:archaellum biogenesis ATPase FlaH
LIVRVSIGVKDLEVVKNFLLSMSAMFSDEHVDVDTTVFNPSRITKIAGVLTSKGANTEDRPHRESKIIYAPEDFKPTSINFIQKIASFVQQEVEAPSYRNNYKSFDLETFIHKHGIQIHHEQTTNGITKYVLEECPFDCNHKAPDAALFRMPNGCLAFKCFHNSCSDKGWRDVRLKYDPNAYNSRSFQYVNNTAQPNYRREDYKPRTEFDTQPKDEPIFWTPLGILNAPKQPKEFMPTGIEAFDKKSRGLPKRGITCISGLRGSGKSSLLTMVTNNWINAGYNVSVFSGELTKEDELDWRTLQLAGKQYCMATQYENFFLVDEQIKRKISEWLEGHFFLYNNAYGNRYSFIIEQMKKCVEEHKVDAIILDNLSALDVSELNPDKFEQQRAFVVNLKAFAMATNTQVMYCVHPRKAGGFLRLSDVAGVSTITDLADDAWIIHRVNNDFKRLSKADLGLRDNHPVYEADNVVEVAKNRLGGMQDELIPLYFQKESKRMMNNRYENKMYGWQKNDMFEELPM